MKPGMLVMRASFGAAVTNVTLTSKASAMLHVNLRGSMIERILKDSYRWSLESVFICGCLFSFSLLIIVSFLFLFSSEFSVCGTCLFVNKEFADIRHIMNTTRGR